MRNLILICAFLFAPLAQAQYVQGGAVNAAPDTSAAWNWQAQTSYSFTFKTPLTAPCTIMVSARFPGQIVSDSQNNTFTNATGNTGKYDELWSSNTCQSGPDTVTITCLAVCWSEFDVAHYSGVWIPDQVSDEVQNVVGTDGWTAPITPSVNGALIIGIGNNHTTDVPGITGANGFTVRLNANQFIADLIQTTAAAIYSEVTYSAPVNWCQRTISFKPGGPPPPFVLKLPGLTNLTFILSDPSQLPSCTAADGTCSLSILICFDGQTCVSGVSGTVSIQKVVTLPVPQTGTVPVIQASP